MQNLHAARVCLFSNSIAATSWGSRCLKICTISSACRAAVGATLRRLPPVVLLTCVAANQHHFRYCRYHSHRQCQDALLLGGCISHIGDPRHSGRTLGGRFASSLTHSVSNVDLSRKAPYHPHPHTVGVGCVAAAVTHEYATMYAMKTIRSTCHWLFQDQFDANLSAGEWVHRR